MSMTFKLTSCHVAAVISLVLLYVLLPDVVLLYQSLIIAGLFCVYAFILKAIFGNKKCRGQADVAITAGIMSSTQQGVILPLCLAYAVYLQCTNPRVASTPPPPPSSNLSIFNAPYWQLSWDDLTFSSPEALAMTTTMGALLKDYIVSADALSLQLQFHHILCIVSGGIIFHTPVGAPLLALLATQAEHGSLYFNFTLLFPTSSIVALLYFVGMAISNLNGLPIILSYQSYAGAPTWIIVTMWITFVILFFGRCDYWAKTASRWRVHQWLGDPCAIPQKEVAAADGSSKTAAGRKAAERAASVVAPRESHEEHAVPLLSSGITVRSAARRRED